MNVVTKAGTNDIHGDVYEFFRNKVLNTKGFFDPYVPDYQQNQFGATLGGPIRKDKTFLFGSYEGNRLKQGIPSGSVYLPTTAEATGDFSADGPFQGAVTDPNFASNLYNRPGCAGALAVTAPTAAAQLQSLANGSSTTPVAYSSLFPNSQVPTSCFEPTANALYKNYVSPAGAGLVQTVPNLIENDLKINLRSGLTRTFRRHNTSRRTTTLMT